MNTPKPTIQERLKSRIKRPKKAQALHIGVEIGINGVQMVVKSISSARLSLWTIDSQQAPPLAVGELLEVSNLLYRITNVGSRSMIARAKGHKLRKLKQTKRGVAK